MLARDVLRRTDETMTQIIVVLDQLEPAGSQDLSSKDHIRSMARAALASKQLQAAGFIANRELLCSSFGRYQPAIQVDAPDYIGADGGA